LVGFWKGNGFSTEQLLHVTDYGDFVCEKIEIINDKKEVLFQQ
jgi:hypothetical protein